MLVLVFRSKLRQCGSGELRDQDLDTAREARLAPGLLLTARRRGAYRQGQVALKRREASVPRAQHVGPVRQAVLDQDVAVVEANLSNAVLRYTREQMRERAQLDRPEIRARIISERGYQPNELRHAVQAGDPLPGRLLPLEFSSNPERLGSFVCPRRWRRRG